MMEMGPVLLFDGVCNLCNSSVQFVIRHDGSKQIRFASLQSEVGQALLKQYSEDTEAFHSLIFINRGKLYKRSAGAIELAKAMGGWMKMLGLGYVLPEVIRDGIYNYVARNRYQWFGKRKEDACLLPTPALKARMLS
jgi:predicted DCC family thiol-disulfide oxidoreductase YuxK